MNAKILDGKSIALKIQKELKKEVDSLIKKHQKIPTLASIQVGQNTGIESYVKAQKKVADYLGMGYQMHILKEDITEEELAECIKKLNNNDDITAIILQLPLPGKLKNKAFEVFIDSRKNAEGMNSENLGNLFYSSKPERMLFGDELTPCTAQAIMSLLDHEKIDLRGKEVVIVGHSEIIGKPLSLLLLNRFATTTNCHIATSEKNHLQEHVERAEILITAVGKANLIKGKWIKDGAVVIDVGMDKVDGRITGDVEFEEAKKRASLITPVPGGVGPLTVTMLMRNVVILYRKQQK